MPTRSERIAALDTAVKSLGFELGRRVSDAAADFQDLTRLDNALKELQVQIAVLKGSSSSRSDEFASLGNFEEKVKDLQLELAQCAPRTSAKRELTKTPGMLRNGMAAVGGLIVVILGSWLTNVAIIGRYYCGPLDPQGRRDITMNLSGPNMIVDWFDIDGDHNDDFCRAIDQGRTVTLSCHLSDACRAFNRTAGTEIKKPLANRQYFGTGVWGLREGHVGFCQASGDEPPLRDGVACYFIGPTDLKFEFGPEEVRKPADPADRKEIERARLLCEVLNSRRKTDPLICPAG